MKRIIMTICVMVMCVCGSVVLTACSSDSNSPVTEEQTEETVSEYQTILKTAMNESFNSGSYVSKFGTWCISGKGFLIDNAIYLVEVFVTGGYNDPETTKDCRINVLIYKNGSLYAEFPEQTCTGSTFSRIATSEKASDGAVYYDVTVTIPSIKDKKGNVAKSLTYKCHTTLTKG